MSAVWPARPEAVPGWLHRRGGTALAGMAVPVACGGGGASMRRLLTTAAGFGRRSGGLGEGLSWLVHTLCTAQVVAPLSEGGEWRAAPADLVARRPLMALAVTDARGSGGPAVAVADGDGWVLQGRKAYVTNGLTAGLTVVLVRIGAPDGESAAFLLPAGTAGLALAAMDVPGLDEGAHAVLTLDGCRLPATARLPAAGAAVDAAVRRFGGMERRLILGLLLGAMERVIRDAVAQGLDAASLGRLDAERQGAEALALRLIDRRRRGGDSALYVAAWEACRRFADAAEGAGAGEPLPGMRVLLRIGLADSPRRLAKAGEEYRMVTDGSVRA